MQTGESTMRAGRTMGRVGRWLMAIAAVCLAAGVHLPAAMAQMAQRDPRLASERYGDPDQDRDDIRESVARISYTTGDTSFNRGDDPDDWQDIDVNVPMATGDRVYAGDDGRLELQVTGGNALRLDARTDLTALDLSDDTKQFSLAVGTASFQVRRLADDENFEVDTPNAAVTFERAGEYRIDVDDDGNTSVGVLRGRATVAAAGGEISLDAGEQMDIQGVDEPEYDVVSLAERDSFDEWVAAREQRSERSRSYEQVSRDIPGCEDLDDYGRWSSIPAYGTVWTPTTVAVGWSPYSDGHWIWQDPWGWTWVASEPWGWAPYHYGRWVYSDMRWYWVPVRTTAVRVRYAPALVAFVGGGSGWSVSVGSSGGGFVGWFPLAPADPLMPWWGSRSRVVNRTTNVTYVNRTHVTVVNRTTFVSGSFVRTNIVRDTDVVRSVSQGPVVTGAIPLTPTRGALRVSIRSSQSQSPMRAERPPRAARTVVVRTTPPPAPLSFDRKETLIREGRGAPVTRAAGARVATQEPQAAKPVVAVKPVAAESGAVKLSPRRQGLEAKQPKPVSSRPGRRRGQVERTAPEAPTPERAAPEAAAPERPRAPTGAERSPQSQPPQSPRGESPRRVSPEPPPPPPASGAGTPQRVNPPPPPPPSPDRPNTARPDAPKNEPGAGHRNARDKVKADRAKGKGGKKDNKDNPDDTKDDKGKP